MIRQGALGRVVHIPAGAIQSISRSVAGGIPIFDYSVGSTTFTPTMAKRNAPGPFAAAPISQGDWATASGDSDTITFSRGTQIAGNFYANFDSDQFWVVMWVTPEWAGNDGVEHVFLQWSTNGYLRKTSGNNLELSVASGVSITTSISSWTAGTTYRVEVRGDADNTLDGTNYLCISIDDVHSFGRTTSYTAEAPSSTIYIGSNSSSQNPANAIVEGLTIYRRPGYDGTNGINASFGTDEIASSSDKTLITGSWGVCFCLPTNASVGALSTGTGHAWSFPHGSNLIPGNSNVGGFMLNGTYTTDGWSDEGTPTAVAALATSEKIFAGGYKTTSDAVDEGIYQDITVSAGNDWVIRVIAHSDGTSQPKVILYDQTNTAEIGSLTGTTTSTRTAPDVLIFSGEAPAGCTTLRVKLINVASSGTTYWHQCELITNRVTNPSVKTGSGDPFVPTGWTNSGSEAGEMTQSTSIFHSGGNALRINCDGNNEGVRINPTYATGEFYAYGAWVRVDAGEIRALATIGTWIDRQTHDELGVQITHHRVANTSGAFQYYCGVLRGDSVVSNNATYSSWVSCDAYVDDVHFVKMTDITLTVTPASQANSDETSGRRVDGRDTLTQAITKITTTSGALRWDYTPRHSAANALKFLGSTNVFIAEFYGDADDYIQVYWSAANTITLAYSMAGATGSNTWDATGAIVANTTYTFEVEYTGGGNMVLKVDDTTRITLSTIPAAFGTVPGTAYWGSRQVGDRQADATFAAPA